MRHEDAPQERWHDRKAKIHQKDEEGNEGKNEEGQRYRQGKGSLRFRKEGKEVII